MSAQRIVPFLTFPGTAEEAMNFYAGHLPGAKIDAIVRFEEGGRGEPGKVMAGILSFFGQKIQFMDMDRAYPTPPMSWSTSFLLYCESAEEFDNLMLVLSYEGEVMMQEDDFLHFKKVAWVTDRYGVTWQPILE